MANFNYFTAQATVTDASYVELAAERSLDRGIAIFAEPGQAFWVSVGHETATDATSIQIPAGGSLVLDPPPRGPIQVKAVSGSITMYMVSS